MDDEQHPSPQRPTEGRLDSWKEVAAYLKRSVTTVQRWERTEELPVHRLSHSKAGSVYGFQSELDEWWRQRSERLEAEEAASPPAPVEATADGGPPRRHGWLRMLPVAAVAALLAAIASLPAWRNRAPGGEHLTLAVLPFQNLSESAEDEYLADGVTEEVITVLARLSPERLGVIARTSVAPYRTQPKTVRDIARELHVDYVLEGSVRHSGGHLRITAQLIEVKNQTHIWASAYERDLSDILRAEAEIAEAIAQRLSLRLLPRPGPSSAAPSREAHVAYLKGLYFWNKRDEAHLRRAIELFREALDLEPGYARAHAGLAVAYARLATSADALAAPQARALAGAEARRALELDPQLPEGHAALSSVLCQFDWNWTECERELQRTLALDPNYATGHHWLGEHFAQRGQLARGQEELRNARALDPLSPTIHTSLGIAYMYARRYDEALACYTQALEIDPRFLLAHRVRGLTLLRSGRVEEGLASLREARGIDARSAHAAADLGYALARAGRTVEARAILDELAELAKQRPVSPYDFAVVYAGLGDNRAALDRLEAGYAEHATGIRWLKVEPIFDPLRGEPRFKELLQRLGLPD